MFIFTEDNKVRELTDAYSPTDIDNFWVLDFDMMDYTLTPLLFLEEHTGKTLALEIANTVIFVPTTWHILISDEETSEIDLVQVGRLMGTNFKAVVYGQKFTRPHLVPIKTLDFFLDYKTIAPALNKHQQLCHPIALDAWVNIAPSDVYNRYIKNKLIGDLI